MKWEADREDSQARDIPSKFKNWRAVNFKDISDLVISLLLPISSLQLESHVVTISLKELYFGFRVVSAVAVSIDSLQDKQIESIRKMIHYNHTSRAEKVCAIAVFDVIHDMGRIVIYDGYGLGEYSNLTAIQEKHAFLNGRQVELLKILNEDE